MQDKNIINYLSLLYVTTYYRLCPRQDMSELFKPDVWLKSFQMFHYYSSRTLLYWWTKRNRATLQKKWSGSKAVLFKQKYTFFREGGTYQVLQDELSKLKTYRYFELRYVVYEPTRGTCNVKSSTPIARPESNQYMTPPLKQIFWLKNVLFRYQSLFFADSQ